MSREYREMFPVYKNVAIAYPFFFLFFFFFLPFYNVFFSGPFGFNHKQTMVDGRGARRGKGSLVKGGG